MTTEFSRYTILEYLPEIRAIYASLEIELAKHNLDHLSELRSLPVQEQYGRLKINYAMMLIGQWLHGTEFTVKHDFFQKKDKKAKWIKMLAFVDAKIMEYYNGEPVIEITLSKDGRIQRTVNGRVFVHDFDGKQKPQIIRALHERLDYYPTDDLKKYLGAKSVDSVSKTIKSINSALQSNLYLPQNLKFIDSKRIDGYRINPIYNIILVK